MLRGNLSTRPFYNERALHLALALATGLAVGFTAFNAGRILALSNERTGVATQAAEAEAEARELREAAARTRSTLDPRQIDAVSASAREANAIIDRRLFSWTELLNYFETTLPPDVRLTSIRPRIEASGATIVVTVVARRVEEVDAFMTALEATGAFANVLSREERATEEGDLVAALEAAYRPSLAAAAADAAPAGTLAGREGGDKDGDRDGDRDGREERPR